ncbi:MAG: cell division protein ZapA [Thermodesulfobacteriota bacterium]
MQKVKINFLGGEYSILTDAEEGYVKEIAGYLESKVKEVNKDGSKLVISHSFLLASLKILDDFFRFKKEFEEYKESAEQKSTAMVELLDNCSKYETFRITQERKEDFFKRE